MPSLGIGTFLTQSKESLTSAIIDSGYRHVDTAFIYENESVVGEALHEVIQGGKVKREDLFVTTKIWHTQYDDVEGAVR